MEGQATIYAKVPVRLSERTEGVYEDLRSTLVPRKASGLCTAERPVPAGTSTRSARVTLPVWTSRPRNATIPVDKSTIVRGGSR